jgi:hypothetical protein
MVERDFIDCAPFNLHPQLPVQVASAWPGLFTLSAVASAASWMAFRG